MNRHALDYCIGAADAYYTVWNDLVEMLSDEQENWRETIVEYLKSTNYRRSQWIDEATTIILEEE